MAHVLVIEDNTDNRELMSYLLRAFGHRVTTALDGEQALERLSSCAFDLVICDVHLPKMDGYQVLAAIRADPGFASLPVIAVTALAMVGDRDRLLGAGFDAYASKPIEPHEFVELVGEWVAACGSAGSAEARAGDA